MGCLVKAKVHKQAKLLAHEYFGTNFIQSRDLPGLVKTPPKAEILRQPTAYLNITISVMFSTHSQNVTFKASIINPQVLLSCFFFPLLRCFVSTQKVSSPLLSPIRFGRESCESINAVSAVNTNQSLITTEIPIHYCFPPECSPAPNHLHYFNSIYHVTLSSLTFPQCPSLISPGPKSMLCVDNFPHVHAGLLFHILYSATLPLGKCPLFFYFPWPHHPIIMLCQHFCVPLASGIPPLIA